MLVDITKDAQQASTQFVWDGSPVRLPGISARAPRPAREDVRRAAELIDARRAPASCSAGTASSRPARASSSLEFVEKTGIPVASTLLGLGGFPATHPLSLGMMGMHGEAWVNTAIQEADLIIALGMRFDDRVTGKLATYAKRAKKIHCELDPGRDQQERPRRRAPHRRRGRDAAHAAARRRAGAIARRGSTRINELKGDSAVRDIQTMPNTPGHLYAAHVMHDLWRITEGKALVVTDVGQHQMWEAQYYKHDFPRKLITSGGLGTMGFALPAAIGAKFARPEEEVWVIVGDGGFQMTAAELSTCAQEGIKVHVAVINNGYLGMVRQWQQFFYGGRYAATPLRGPDFVKLAEAHGLLGLRVTERDRARERRREGRARGRGHGRHRFPRRAGRQRLPDGAGRGRPRTT